ncbi:hypothetical protein ACIBQ2_05175 [Micromonospora sediminimaris]|uniref:Uncharacterized protein n=1 Tax=Micromonospora sediminimaris TaxID=547162 RepID=A0A9W5UQE8_9ACTN|nr:hypothetical protein [Micromonospora sediminimaris]GIJ32709.1 hypothetical protein Vse01_18570 [Micromonospora sediminimaris]SFD15968.1 hypothetical protein SAMN05216284_11213 [Micromonospora sediminimaris]
MIVVAFDAPVDEPAQVTGFELGHVSLRWDGGAHSSRQFGSRGLLMVYLAAADMLHGVATLLARRDDSYVFTGASSAWSFALRRTRRHGLHLSTPAGRLLCHTSEAEYAMAVWHGTERLLATRTPIDGGPLTDLRTAMAAFPDIYRR